MLGFEVAYIMKPIMLEERVSFWQWMVNELSQVHRIICGDFNMVDSQEDKKGMLPIRLPQHKKEAKSSFKARSKLYDLVEHWFT